jgi:small redox-active disulfide protein 2
MVSTRLIQIGPHKVGVVGLDTALEDLSAIRRDLTDGDIAAWLLDRLAAENYIPHTARSDYGQALVREFKKYMGLSWEDEPGGGIEIKVLGPGCPRCDGIEQHALAALAELGEPADVEHVRDVVEIARYGVVGVPALLINGTVMSVGHVPSKEKIKQWIMQVGSWPKGGG